MPSELVGTGYLFLPSPSPRCRMQGTSRTAVLTGVFLGSMEEAQILSPLLVFTFNLYIPDLYIAGV
jgi:hypothetical protein